MKQQLKEKLMPMGPKPRRLPAGLARGVEMEINFSYQTRLYLGLYEVELNRHLKRMLSPGRPAFDVGGQFGYDALVIAKFTGAPVTTFDCDPVAIGVMQRAADLNAGLGSLVSVQHATISSDGDASIDAFAFANGAPPPGFLKVDIDGGEGDALRGASRLLAEVHPHVIVETHSAELERECGAILVEHGYRPTIVHQRAIWPDRRPIAHNRWLVAYGR
jgi:hypothetical protein